MDTVPCGWRRFVMDFYFTQTGRFPLFDRVPFCFIRTPGTWVKSRVLMVAYTSAWIIIIVHTRHGIDGAHVVSCRRVIEMFTFHLTPTKGD